MNFPKPSLLPAYGGLYRRVYAGVNYRLRGIADGRLASLCRPVSICLLVTERCNARCIHCDIWKNRGQEDSPSVEEWKDLLRQLAHWLGPVQVTLSGGEALLRPWTPELVAAGSSFGLFMEVLTHGYWKDQGRMEQMALAGPGRITISVDGIGETHSGIRGRDKFWESTLGTIQNLRRIRAERNLPYSIRLKTVIMERNLDEVTEVARFATASGLDVVYQPIEQNYNTAEDPAWFQKAGNWPRDAERAVLQVEELIRLKREGLAIANSEAQLRAMIPYFRDPDSMRVRVQSHSGHERVSLCAALTLLQVQANGDVTTCSASPAVGNIRSRPIRDIWNSRPRWWERGCCLERRYSVSEQESASLATLR